MTNKEQIETLNRRIKDHIDEGEYSKAVPLTEERYRIEREMKTPRKSGLICTGGAENYDIREGDVLRYDDEDGEETLVLAVYGVDQENGASGFCWILDNGEVYHFIADFGSLEHLQHWMTYKEWRDKFEPILKERKEKYNDTTIDRMNELF